jgi:hypothetical protein
MAGYMDWLAKIFFPKSDYYVRHKGLNTLLLVAGVTLIFCVTMTVIICMVNSKHH